MFRYDLSDWFYKSFPRVLPELLSGFLPCSFTFLQQLQLVILVVDFCLKSVPTMLNACVISSFMRLVF